MSTPKTTEGRRLRCGAVALLLALPLACSTEPTEAPASGPRPILGLAELLEDATAAPRATADLPPGASIENLAGGLAIVGLPLSMADAATLPSDGHHYTWQLPWPVRQDAAGDRTWPTIDVPGTEPLAVDVGPDRVVQRRAERPAPERTDAWIDGRTLHVFGQKAAPADMQMLLHYPIQAARLVGGSGHYKRVDELSLARVETPTGSNAALVLEAGTRLTLPMGSFPGATLHARLVASDGASMEPAADDSAPAPLSVQLSFPGAAGQQVLEAGRSPRPVEILLPAGHPDQPGSFTFEASGPAGSLVRLEEPRLAFGDVPALAERPNVLFVILDTLRADRLGVYGNTDGLSPNLDRLAAESLVFEECWSTSSWTMPAISGMLTSAHQEVHGGIHENSRINPALDTLASSLAAAGYDTEAICEGGLFRAIYGHDAGFRSFVEHREGIAHGADLAREFFERKATEPGAEPWFLVLHSYEVHEPYEPDPALLATIRAGLPPHLAERITRPTDFAELYHNGEWTAEVSAEVSAAMEALYDAEVQVADAVLGELLDELRAAGTLDDTLVVVTADHGEEFGEHGMIGHGDSLYPELLHVPFLVRFPDGWRAGEVESHATSQLHLAPTVLDAVGLGAELDQLTFSGESLLRGMPEVPIYAWRYREGERSLYALRVGDELVLEGTYDFTRAASGQPEVYDLSDDPGAASNIGLSDPERFERLSQLLSTVRELYSEDAFEGGSVRLDESTRARLEALGYL